MSEPLQHEGDLDRLVARVVEDVWGGEGAGAAAKIEGLAAAIGLAWVMGARAVMAAARGLEPCRICGCTETKACEGGCAWAEPGLCTKCEGLE